MTSDRLGAQVWTLFKDPGLIAVVIRLCDCWGDRAFEVVDHGEANFHGVGLPKKGLCLGTPIADSTVEELLEFVLVSFRVQLKAKTKTHTCPGKVLY